MTTTFKDLVFKKDSLGTGIQGKIFFPNGFGASVVRSYGSYGYEQNLYEMAILKGNADEWIITYSTTITNDVLGYLTENDVTKDLAEVEALKSEGGTMSKRLPTNRGIKWRLILCVLAFVVLLIAAGYPNEI